MAPGEKPAATDGPVLAGATTARRLLDLIGRDQRARTQLAQDRRCRRSGRRPPGARSGTPDVQPILAITKTSPASRSTVSCCGSTRTMPQARRPPRSRTRSAPPPEQRQNRSRRGPGSAPWKEDARVREGSPSWHLDQSSSYLAPSLPLSRQRARTRRRCRGPEARAPVSRDHPQRKLSVPSTSRQPPRPEVPGTSERSDARVPTPAFRRPRSDARVPTPAFRRTAIVPIASGLCPLPERKPEAPFGWACATAEKHGPRGCAAIVSIASKTGLTTEPGASRSPFGRDHAATAQSRRAVPAATPAIREGASDL